MKTFTKILTAAAATALLATGCVNEDPAYKNNEPGTPPDPNAKGYLTLADMSMRVVVDTDTETRPDDTSDETAKPQTRTDEAQPDVDTFIIEIRDATGKLALQETYGDLKASIGEAGRLELPVGGYTMEVRSEEAATTPAAEWEHPVYFGSQEFVIEKNQTTPINEVVCTLNNIKVTLMCSKDLADQLTADTKSTVTLGETTMTFLKDETRAAYFMPQGETNTLKLHLEGAFADTPDAPVRINKSISGVKAGQWRKLSIVITYSDKGDIKLDIDVNDFMEDDEIPVNDPDNPGEPGLPVAPTLECPGYDLTKPFQLLASMFDAQGNYTRPFAFNLASSNGIGSFAVKITSDNSRLTGMVSGIGGPEFDLCTIGASDPAYTVLAGLGFPLGDDLKGATSKSFDIAGAMKLLYPAYEGTHAFAFEITDAKGLSARASLTLTVDPANEGPSIVGVDFNIDETQTPSADRDTEIDITAQTGIKSLDVTIDCDNLDARELGTMGIPARFDLCNIEGFEDTNGTMHPAEDVREAISAAAFGENFHAWVVAADAFDEGQVQQGGVPALNYTADGTGYFTMPEGATTLTTRFEGTHPDRGVIVREARFEGVQTGGKYSVSFRFSKDLPGFIECFVVKVDTSTDDYDDTFPFSPEPSIESDGFDMDQPQDFIPGTTAPKRYMITTMAAVKSVVIGIGDDSYEALNGTTEGVEVTRESDLSLTVTLSDAFFAGRPGGSHPVSIRVTDSAGAEATAISEYRLQGLLPIEKTDYDLWTNSLTLRALVLDPNVTTATFGLRVKDGEWSDAEGVNAGEGIYTATFTAQWKESVNAAGLTVHTPVAGTGVFAGNSYEARAALDGETVSSAEFQAAAGQVIPDGDMESGSLPCFGKSTSESTTFWGSGNAATSGLCAQSTKPGMGGSYCAKLESQSAFGLLAAGNLFSATFRFASLSGTASFGMPYQWTARPTALRLKYHATVGAVNKGTVTEEHEYIQDGQDRSRIFAVIVDWNSRHATVAGMGSPTGVWDPAKTAETAEGPVIAYGSLLIGETTPGDAMTTVEIPIEYYDRTTKPTGAYTLVISCTTSAYGDFKVGCLGNVMYVDDFEWVY